MQAALATFYRKYGSRNSFWVVCILIASCVVILPIAFMGIPDNFDLLQHLRFGRTFYDAVMTADISPGWAAADNGGLGSVGVRFYPPLAYIVMAATQLATHSWFDTLWTNILLWMFLGCLGVFFWSREWLPKPQAAAAAVLYAVIPYHLLQIYQAFLFAEFAASAILPFCFLFATRIVRRNCLIDTVLFTISFSALVLTHIPSTIIGTVCLGIYTLLLLDRGRFPLAASRFALAFAASIAATSYYWLRFVTELSWVKHNSPQFYAAGYYDYSRYFFPMLLGSRDLYLQRSLWTFDAVIVITILLFLPACIVIALRNRPDGPNSEQLRVNRALLITGLFAVFMMSFASTFLWTNISFLQKLQFPWRWLSAASLMASVAFVMAVSELIKRGWDRKVTYPAVILVVLILLYDVSQQIIPSTPLSRETLSAQISGIDDEEGCECWWPIWGTHEAFADIQKVNAGPRPVKILEWSGMSRRFSVESGEYAQARVATFYYPHWHAEVNGLPVDIERNDDGTMSVPISSRASDVKVFFEEPASSRAAKLVSFLSMTAIFLMLAACVVTRRHRQCREHIS